MAFYWKLKTFKTFNEMEEWTKANDSKYQIRQIFVMNEWAIEYKGKAKM